MSIWPVLADEEMAPSARAVLDDIRAARVVKHEPATLTNG